MKTAVLVVDGANWSRSLEGGRYRIDFDRLISNLQKATNTKIIAFLYYTAYRNREDLNRRMGFLNYLSNMGWQVQAMPATLGPDGRWRDKEVDIAIALDAYDEVTSGRAETVILGSGDEDFAALFRRLPEGVQGWALGFRDHMSPMLRTVAKTIFMEDLGVLYRVPDRLGINEREDW